MLGKNTLRFAFYFAVGALILTLTGIFNAFERREVIEDQLTLSTFVLLLILFAAGFFAAHHVRARGWLIAALNGTIASVIVGASLAVLVWFQANVDLANIIYMDLGFIFRNLTDLSRGTLMLEQETIGAGVTVLLIVSAVMGVIAGLSAILPPRIRNITFLSIALTVVFGILQDQVNNIVTIADALSLLALFALGYVLALRSGAVAIPQRALWGFGAGFVLGVGLLIVMQAVSGMDLGDFERILRRSTILQHSLDNPIFFVIITTGTGIAGSLVSRAGQVAHNGAWYLITMLIVLGILDWQRDMNVLAAVLILSLFVFVMWSMPPIGRRAAVRYEALDKLSQRRTRWLAAAFALAVLLVVPGFVGQSISNTFNLVMLYIMMGIGLNVMIGFTGLLDLGYVASFAIGAYTAGLLTTPSLLTCGGQTADAIADAAALQGIATAEAIAQTCTGVMTFWQAWPAAIFVAAFTGMMLGVPVLRLRGDYLAIVTLGFGEIVNRLLQSATFADLLGGPQGVSPIPVPTIQLAGIMPQINLPVTQVTPEIFAQQFTSVFIPNYAWNFSLSRATEIYYLYLFAVIVAVFVVTRLVHTRLGRAWRAVREDEDVAEAMGIHLVWTKLLAFGISSAMAGLGGAIFGASLQGIFPNSFTLLVSINVLSLIIIGGMGSIPGVIVGAFVLIGLPEVLRELQDYRLLAFGALLVVAMITMPDGLIPPRPPQLSERAKIPENDSSQPQAQAQPAGD